MPHYAAREATTNELEVGGMVQLKGKEWRITAIHGPRVRITDGVRTFEGERETWMYHQPLPPVDTSNHLTVQEYLLGCGIEPERLQTTAKTFGSVLSAQFRKRHGKDAERVRKLEYVPYLDTTGGEGANAVGPSQIKESGWYESLAYAPEDRDLMDGVRAARLPALGPYRTPEERAIEVLDAHGLEVEHAVETENPDRGIAWVAEEVMRRCAASGQVCGHEACSRRRGARWKGSEERAEGDMFE